MTHDEKRFTGQVQAVIAGTFPQGRFLTLGNTPTVLCAVGVPELKLIMRPSKIHQIIKDHNITVNSIIEVPAKLAKPIMLFNSGTQKNAIVALLDLKDCKGNLVIAAVHIAVRQRTGSVNFLASVYGKDNAPRWITEQINKDRLLYIDKKKALWLSDSTGFQLSGDVLSKARADDTRHAKNLSQKPQKVKQNQSSYTLTLNRKKGSDNENQ